MLIDYCVPAPMLGSSHFSGHEVRFPAWILSESRATPKERQGPRCPVGGSVGQQRPLEVRERRFCGTCSVKSHFNAFLNAAQPGRPTAKRSDSGPPAGPRYESATIQPSAFRERRDLSAHPGVARDGKDENRVAAQQASCIIAGGKKAKMNFPLSCSNTEMLAREFTVVTRRVWPLWLDEYLPFYCAPR